MRCEDIMPGRWTTQLVNKHLGYRYTGVFKTLASIDDKPSRFEILIPLVQTLVRDNVKLNNDVYKELNKFMHDYDKHHQNEKIPSEHQRVHAPYKKYSSSGLKHSKKEVILE